MEATEFRLGNIFHWGDHWTTIDINKIRDWDSLYGKAAEGEPLTEEWLLKFGFEKRGTAFWRNGYAFRFYDGGTLSMHRPDIPRERDGVKYEPHNFIKSEIGYVHKFQNIWFELTGEELTYA
ncbi:MAG: hypothetical protein GY861_05505 [bacterium]|nr:hypothetical protein [bacterium]